MVLLRIESSCVACASAASVAADVASGHSMMIRTRACMVFGVAVVVVVVFVCFMRRKMYQVYSRYFKKYSKTVVNSEKADDVFFILPRVSFVP